MTAKRGSRARRAYRWLRMLRWSPWHRGYGAGWDDAMETAQRMAESHADHVGDGFLSADDLKEIAEKYRLEAVR